MTTSVSEKEIMDAMKHFDSLRGKGNQTLLVSPSMLNNLQSQLPKEEPYKIGLFNDKYHLPVRTVVMPEFYNKQVRRTYHRKKRIRKKWKNDPRNWDYVPWDKAFLINEDVIRESIFSIEQNFMAGLTL